MRKITAIPSQKIAFKNVPISGLFFSKRTFYQKTTIDEATIYNQHEVVYFQKDVIVRFISKMHENVAIELVENKVTKKKKSNDIESFDINDTVDIIDRSILGKVVSVDKDKCLIQFKDPELDTVCFTDFPKSKLRKIKTN